MWAYGNGREVGPLRKIRVSQSNWITVLKVESKGKEQKEAPIQKRSSVKEKEGVAQRDKR